MSTITQDQIGTVSGYFFDGEMETRMPFVVTVEAQDFLSALRIAEEMAEAYARSTDQHAVIEERA